MATRQPGTPGRPFKESSFRRRMSVLRMFFIRIVEWDWDDAPARVPILFGDVPERDESLPKFLDDGDYAKFMRAVADEPTLFRRLGVELLARTGMRVGELCDLEADAVTIMNGEPWLRIPVGKLHNDRYVPLQPILVDLIAEYQASDGPFTPGRLLSGAEGPLNRYAVDRWIKTIARRAGLTTNVHPHRLRHTFATQAINRGMTIDVIAVLLGHRSLDMTRRYAQISNQVVAAEYAAVAAKVEALYTTGDELDADAIGPKMRTRPRRGPPPTLGQRLVPTTSAARLQLRVDLRDLRPFQRPTTPSSPSCSANATTPPPTTRPPEPNSSPICSPRSETQNDRHLFLDSRHLHIAGTQARIGAFSSAIIARV